MPKRIFGVRGESHLVDELRCYQLVDGRPDLQAFQQVTVEAGTDNRRGGERVFGRRAEPVDTGGNGRLQGGRHADVGHIGATDIVAALTDEHTALGEVAGDLLREERVAGSARGDYVAYLAQ